MIQRQINYIQLPVIHCQHPTEERHDTDAQLAFMDGTRPVSNYGHIPSLISALARSSGTWGTNVDIVEVCQAILANLRAFGFNQITFASFVIFFLFTQLFRRIFPHFPLKERNNK